MPARPSNRGTSPKATGRTTQTAGGTGNRANPSRTPPHEGGVKRGSLHFFSCGISLPSEAVKACKDADLIVASERLLKKLGHKLGEDRLSGRATIVLDAKARTRMNKAKKAAESGRTVVVLASGDALFHGIGSTFVKGLGPEVALALKLQNLEIDENESRNRSLNFGLYPEIAPLLAPELPFELVFHPGPTAAQALCHRLGIPFDNVSVFCCHSKEEHEIPAGEISRTGNLAIIYTGHPCTPKVIAERLLEFEPYQGDHLVLVASELGTPEEKLFLTNLAGAIERDFPPTSMMLLFPDGGVPLPLPLAAPDEDYQFDKHVITNRWIRPALLGALELVPGTILWDLGAGSGSVSIEASLICPNLTVHAVEKKQQRCAHITQNVRTLGAVNYHLHKGDILRLLPKLAKNGLPQSVFIGGGGKDVPKILDWLLANCRNLGVTIVAVAVTLDTLGLLSHYPRKNLVTMFAMSVEEGGNPKKTDILLPEPGHRIHVFCYRS